MLATSAWPPAFTPQGPLNVITDVPGVLVGHRTLIEDTDIRTGVTAVLPHGGNILPEKALAAALVFNAFGKTIGLAQVRELGVLENPHFATNTLAVWKAADALRYYTPHEPGNEGVRSGTQPLGLATSLTKRDGYHLNYAQIRFASAAAFVAA